MELREIFSKNIKLLRKRDNITQRQLAEKLCYSEKAIAKWESGSVMPTVETLSTLSQMFGCSIDYLLTLHDKIYYLGIDGGGTSTKYSLADEKGNIISRYVGVGCNPVDIGWEKCIEVLKNGISNICDKISYSSVVVYAGISGLRTCVNKNEIIENFTRMNFQKVFFGSDVDNALSAGLGDSDGIVAIMGTGISVIQRKNSKFSFLGGWGYLIDNGGSGYNLGLDAFKAYFDYLDGIGEKTVLVDMIPKKAKLEGRNLCSEIYQKGKRYIASFSKEVFDAVELKDKVAKQILTRNVNESANLILKATQNFDKNVKIALTGGIAEAKIFNKELINILENNGYKNICVVDVPLSDGAVKMAMKLFNDKKQ